MEVLMPEKLIKIYEVTRPLNVIWLKELGAKSSPIRHVALIFEMMGHKNEPIAYLLEAEGDSRYFGLWGKIKARLSSSRTLEFFINEHDFKVINKREFHSNKITREHLNYLKGNFNRDEHDYYPFNYSMHPRKINGKNYGINCWGFKDYILCKLGLENYKKSDVKKFRHENSLSPHLPDLPIVSIIKEWPMLISPLGPTMDEAELSFEWTAANPKFLATISGTKGSYA
jgi:uncharacterized protein (DUF488 family)